MRGEQLRKESRRSGEFGSDHARDASDAQANDRESGERTIIPRLVHLADAHELEVAKGEADVRGWTVRTADGKEVGVVHDLIVDAESMKVRYLEARIDHEALSGSKDRFALVPIESAALDRDNSVVNLNAAIVDARSLPPSERQAASDSAASASPDGLPVVHTDHARLTGQPPQERR